MFLLETFVPHREIVKVVQDIFVAAFKFEISSLEAFTDVECCAMFLLQYGDC